MIDYTKWKQASKAATSLQLDQRNPRLLPRSAPATQPELVAEMIEHEDVYAMAKSIVERGFFPHELIIGIEEGGRVTVVEGNRRVCAVKLLISPTLAPEKERSRFKKLSHKANIGQIRKLTVLIAPSRDAAAPLIQSRHTRVEIEKWSPVMQARFYADRIADGNTVDELAEEFTIPPGQIREFVQNYQMYCVACNLDLPPAVAAKVKDPRVFPLSSLERIYRNKDAAAFLGISFDEKGSLKGSIPAAEFKKAFGKVVTDVASGTANSRKLNNDDGIKKYLATFGDAAPDGTKKGAFTAKDVLGATTKVTPMPLASNSPSKKATPPQKSLIARSFTCEIEDVKIVAVIGELKRIAVDSYPNAVALTLRGLLDMTFGDYVERLGATDTLIARLNKKNDKPDDWFPSLRQILNFLINEEKTLPIHPLASKAAKLLVKDESGVTLLMLDQFAHNNRVIPSPSELRSFWAKIEESVQAMLTPIPSNSSV